jgi:phenylalanyl-tRNA synthetase beta chain
MPVVGIPVDMLLSRIATTVDRDQLVLHLQHLGCDVEGYTTLRRFGCQRCDNILEITPTENPPVLCDRCSTDFRTSPEMLTALGESDVIRMELLAVRPDMFDPGGLARVLRNYLSESDQPAQYTLQSGEKSVTVDPRLAADTSYRPKIACAIVRGITLDDDLLKAIMKLQENLHWALGRDRKHASIGVYDLDTVSGNEFQYRVVGPEELSFVPLGYDLGDASASITPREVLEKHPKGIAYARLLAGFDGYPLLTDETGKVMSLPPIINSEETRVTRQTKNFFIDVTGTDQRIVDRALNILATSLAELDKSVTLEEVAIRYDKETLVTPNLTPQKLEFELAKSGRVIGVDLTDDDVVANLRKMGHGIAGQSEKVVDVAIPAYRNDIMHPIDLVEDVAIAYGYHNIDAALVPTMTVGVERPEEHYSEIVRRSMTGLGCTEVITLILSSPEVQYDALLLPHRDDCVLIENPISVEQTQIRTSLVPGLLDTFAANTAHEMPQRIFESGNISHLCAERETGAAEERLVAGGAIGPRVDYAEIRSLVEALMRDLGFVLEVKPSRCPSFIPGRGATIIAQKDGHSVEVGEMGELQPEILERFKLVQPTAIFEFSLQTLVLSSL